MWVQMAVFAASVGLAFQPQDSRGAWQIEVRDTSGAGVEGATCKVMTAGGEEVKSGRDGVCRFRNALPAGGARPNVEIRKAGFASEQTTSQSVTLRIDRTSYSAEVIASTPLPGAGMTRTEIAAPVQVVTSEDAEKSGSLDLSDLLNRRISGVHWNEIQNNPFQPDVNYRGFTASPLLGTPQGLSLYMDGMRMNQPFGDIVSWDLIPKSAIQEVAVMPGSNPLFGLNTLGGALAVQTKDGFTAGRTSITGLFGSFGRRNGELEHGGASLSSGMHWFLSANLFGDDGWRESSPTTVRQYFGKIGRQRSNETSVALSGSYANNALIGNGLQDQQFLVRKYSSIYTKPDATDHKAGFLNFMVRHNFSSVVSLNANAYYRNVRTRTLNGDLNDDALDQSVYQPNAAERAALTAAGYTGFPLSGENASNTPFPFWRCIAQSLLRDEPAEKCNGALNRSTNNEHNGGASGQVTWFHSRNQFTAGAAFDKSHSTFGQLAQLGYLNPDRSVTGVNSFGDGVTGGDEDGVPFDTRVDLRGSVRTSSLYASNLFRPGRGLVLNLAGRFNTTTIQNRDRINPGGGPGSLDGTHTFRRFNPSAGITYSPNEIVNFYFSYAEGSRAPTSIELGCADPEQPCRLPNSMAGDPPLLQVVSRTLEAGVRSGAQKGLLWNVGWFRTNNRDDILFVASEQTGFGYFKNFGRTLRQGLQLDARWTDGKRLTAGFGYTFLDATFRSEEDVNGEANSTSDDEIIEIEPGNRIPLSPRHIWKAFADVQATSRLTLNLGITGTSSSFARGNENNQHAPDGRYFIGPGSSSGYGVVSMGGRFRLTRHFQIFAQVNNLFDRQYYTAAQLGATGFTADGSFIARPFPAVDGEFPLRHSTFFAPGAPRLAWGGFKLQF
jgi:outer membrane receptor protein involved in Fe transport